MRKNGQETVDGELPGLFAGCFVCFCGAGRGNGSDRVPFGCGGFFAAIWAAADAGFFKKQNLSVELVSIRSSPVAMSALLSGEVDVVVGGVVKPEHRAAIARLQRCRYFCRSHQQVFSIYSQPGIDQLFQLKGKRLGVTRFGGSNDFAGRYYLRQRGLDPTKDLTMIQIGSQDDILRALLAKNLDAAVLGYPAVYVAKKSGLRELADLTQSGLRYQLTAFVAKRSFSPKSRRWWRESLRPSPNRFISCGRGPRKAWRSPNVTRALTIRRFSPLHMTFT